MLSLPLVLLSLHALAVYSAPTKDSDDVAVLRRGGMIHGLTLRREEYHQFQKRAVSICGVSARDASNSDCTKRYPSTLRKRGSVSKRQKEKVQGGTEALKDPHLAQITDKTAAAHPNILTIQVLLNKDKMSRMTGIWMSLKNKNSKHWEITVVDHLVELQVASPTLTPHCQQISTRRATLIKDYLNDPNHNLYLINGKVNLAKGAATKRAMLRLNDHRPRTYASSFEQSVWAGVVRYLQAKASVARTNAAWIETTTGLTNTNIANDIYEVYDESLQIALAMYNSYTVQSSQQTSQDGSGGSSPHSQGSGSSSGLSDPPNESTVTFNGRPLTLYEYHGVWYYVYSPGNGHADTYLEYTQTNLYYYPPS
ncbi:hypothetical protein EDD18DRAFT_1102194 [Armillaria luteobubalina]|uniref:Uncharacterized protein n=1 Tax=Armillaria luteobubalina TaxID=153913 RepID=A0AA39QE14_9AGAR|nr:hypothetical protein EDD18DRAFT_1102194 [Armillaria luteobubalina]